MPYWIHADKLERNKCHVPVGSLVLHMMAQTIATRRAQTDEAVHHAAPLAKTTPELEAMVGQLEHGKDWGHGKIDHDDDEDMGDDDETADDDQAHDHNIMRVLPVVFSAHITCRGGEPGSQAGHANVRTAAETTPADSVQLQPCILNMCCQPRLSLHRG